MKRTQVLTAFMVMALVFSTSCGVSDSIKSLLLTAQGPASGSFFNLVGQDGTIQLKVFSVYNSGKKIDVTNSVTWSVVPTGTDDNLNPLPAYGPATVPINATGLMTGIVPICTWVDLTDNSKTPAVPFNPPVWAYTGYYQTTASYRGFTSQPVAIGVGVATSNNSPVGGCGPA